MFLLDRPGAPRLACRHHAGSGPVTIFLPGYGSDMTGAKAQALDVWAERNGRGFVRFDYRGCGASEGVFADATLADWSDDVLAIIDSLPAGPLVLAGSSLGGWLMLLAALARPERIVGLVGIAAAPDFTDWGFDDTRRHLLHADGLIAEESTYSDAPTITTLPFWRSGQANLLLDGPIAINAPVRLLHGLADTDVPPSIAFRLGRALRSADVRTILVKDGDHRLSRPQDLRLLTATVAELTEAA